MKKMDIKQKLLNFLVLSFLSLLSLSRAQTGDDWIDRSASPYQYLFQETPQTCEAAEKICEESLAHLVTVNNQAENNYVKDIAKGRDISIGYWKNSGETAFKWKDASSSTFTNWRIEPANLFETECYCAYMTPTEYQWDFDTCTAAARPFICQRPKDICSSSIAACKNGGTCVQEGNDFKCNCQIGTEGKQCENVVDMCTPSPCLNKGTCRNELGKGAVCYCRDGYTGNSCEINIDECVSGPCQNGGSCIDGENSYTCNCLKYYNGTLCAGYYPPANMPPEDVDKPQKASVAIIIVPILLVVVLIIAAIIILCCIKRKKQRRLDEEVAMKDIELKQKLHDINAEYVPEGDPQNDSYFEPINDLKHPPQDSDKVQYSSIIPPTPILHEIDMTDKTPLKEPQYADLHFPHDPNSSLSSEDKPKPKPRPRHTSVEGPSPATSPYATTNVVNPPKPEPTRRRPKPRSRPKSTANLMDIDSAPDHNSSLEVQPTQKKVTVKRNESLLRSTSRDALNDLTLDPAQDSFKDVKGRLAQIMQEQGKTGAPGRASVMVPIVHPRAAPKSILKKPKQQFYPTMQELQQARARQSVMDPSGHGALGGTTV